MRKTNSNARKSIGVILLLSNSIFLSNLSSANTNANVDTRSSIQNKDYYYQMDIHTSGDSSLQELLLTERVYAKINNTSKRISVVDSLGKALPHDIISFRQSKKKQVKDVSIYPLYQAKFLLKQTERIILKYDEASRLSEINSKYSKVAIDNVAGYILDLGEQVLGYNHSLHFNLSATQTTALLNFDIDQSQNLKDWSRLSTGEVLAQLHHGEMTSQRKSVDITGYTKRYLRLNITTINPQFTLESAQLNYFMKKAKDVVWNEYKEAIYDTEEKAYILDILQSQIFTALQIEMLNSPSIFSGNVYSRINKKTSWSKHNTIRLFNISKDGAESLNNTLELNHLNAGQMKITVNYQNSIIKDNKLKIRLASEPQKLIFFANGQPPYRLNIGNNKLENGLISSDSKQLLKILRQQLGNTSKLASLGDIRKVNIIQKTISKKIDWWKIGLWFILLSGVVLMIWMARRLLGQLNE